MLPARIRRDVVPYLPDCAGVALLQTTQSRAQLPPWTGFAAFTAFTAVALLAAALLLRHRDA